MNQKTILDLYRLRTAILPEPKIQIVHDPLVHSYVVNGKFQAPSVTQIISTAFPDFFTSQRSGFGRFSTMLEAASRFGQSVHAAIHYDLENDLNEESVSDDVMGCVKAARKFCKDFNLAPVGIELPVASILPLYAGRLDTLMVTTKKPKRYWLIDWKTGIETETVRIQLEAYAKALLETYGLSVHHALPIYLSADGTYQPPKDKELARDPLDYKAFQAAHTIWTWRQKKQNKETKKP